jgi:G:T-mismatch repair DNA endonuclease (very short patch repair protein)
VADVFTKKKRSQVMAAIRSTGNRATELRLAAILRAHGITGWRRHQPLPGKPDFVFRRERETTRRLKTCGWNVLRVWEHALRSPCVAAHQNGPTSAHQNGTFRQERFSPSK